MFIRTKFKLFIVLRQEGDTPRCAYWIWYMLLSTVHSQNCIADICFRILWFHLACRSLFTALWHWAVWSIGFRVWRTSCLHLQGRPWRRRQQVHRKRLFHFPSNNVNSTTHRRRDLAVVFSGEVGFFPCQHHSTNTLYQCFSTFVRPRPGKLFLHKTRARSQQIYS